MFNKESWLILLAFAVFVRPLAADCANVFETTQLAAATVAEDARVPAPVVFEVAANGSYTITLTDLVMPVNLKSLRAIVTHGMNSAAQVQVTYPSAGQPQASVSFDAVPGTYRVHVLATAADNAVGGFGLRVAPSGGGAALVDSADVIAAPSAPGSGQSALQARFDVAQPGAHRLVLQDLNFPEPLAGQPQSLLLRDTASGPVIVPLDASGMFDAVAGSYQLVVFATASATTLSGLYNVRIDTEPATTPIYETTQPVGNLPPALQVTIANAGTHVLTMGDAVFPASLTGLSAVVTQNGSLLATLATPGTVNVVAVPGTAQIYVSATPASAEGVGAYSVKLTRAGTEVYADVVAVDASPDPQSPAIYSVEAGSPITAGPYELKLVDFARPEPLTSLKAALAQGSAVRGLLPSEGTAQFNLQAGRLKVLVALRLPGSGAEARNGLFGLTITPGGAGAPLLESTRGVGGFFRSHPVPINAAGHYDLTLKDFAFPAQMKDPLLVVTRGTDLIAEVYGSGTVAKQSLAAGTYVLNFLGQPAAGQSYGTYGLSVDGTPSAPVVTLTADATTITSGQSTMLRWSATDATGCTASNAWSGAKGTSGPESTGVLNTTSKFELICTGPGGTSTASVTVTVNVPNSSRSGGGSMDWLALIALGLLTMSRRTFGRGRKIGD